MKKQMLWMAAALACAGAAQAKEPVDYVNTKIGNISHMLVPVFPAVQLPNGMLRVTPPNESFTTDRINGFCLSVPSHRQGQVFQMMPFSGEAAALRPGWSSRYDQAEALPYRYSVFLDDYDARVELAPGRKAAIYSVTFESDKPRFILLQPKQKGSLTIDGATVSGTDDYHGVTVYVYLEFDAAPSRVGAFEGETADFARRATRDSNRPVVAQFDASVKTVRMRYGISYISVEQAKKNLAGEIADFDLARLAKNARGEWNRVLGRIRVKGGTEDERAVFYTALYRCHERMVNISEDGRYFSAWDGQTHEDGGVPFWTDDWSWDTYHALHPLTALLHPAAESAKLTSYVRMCEQSGWMPTFPTVFGDAHCMNGQHPVALFLDAWRKGVRGFDAAKAYEGLKKTIREESLIPWHRGPATELDRFYWDKGYMPALRPGEPETVKEVKPGERRQAVAVTLAASYDNWCLAQLAKELGKTEDHAFFLKRSYDYRNLWRKDTGFFHPKDKDGNWIEPFNYKYAGGQGARDYYDENNAWTYIWEVYHNVDDLIALFGGRQAFTDKLDRLFTEGYDRPRWEFYNVLPDSTGNVGMFVMGNEPSFHIPYLYNFAGEPWKTQKRVRMLMEAWFRNDLMGICGDEDGGGMSAFAVFTAMGFYPVTAGVPAYTFGSPLFSEVRIRLDSGKEFVLRAPAADREHKYIQSVRLNGKPWNKTWFPHEALVNGGSIVLELGDRPNKTWGVETGAAPFSESTKD
ncbi:MAG TPA: GH92 family glycosyl hydrolase [Kiritimatiellia bacterium]|nr:GH92 family glycosyl hydrolase [Kiritimatiellia bacterium]HPS09439.1 GH92 family glycosyl hydrolase [Kiritimatiellia bacterium]